MNSIFDSMPGMEMPISQLKSVLSEMWQSFQENEKQVQAASRASQMNLILHNGLNPGTEEAIQCFNVAIEFAKKHPCRIVVLCPEENIHQDVLKAKLFSQCYTDQTLREDCCCEAIILGYSINNSQYLKDVVSLWIESDLPSYYWINQVHAYAINKYYLPLVQVCKKIVYDSRVESMENFTQIQWPEKIKLADLALLRLLPVRQSLGQFLSAFTPSEIVDGLQTVNISYQKQFIGKGIQFLEWIKECLNACLAISKQTTDITFNEHQLENDSNTSISTQWTYNNNKNFTWTLNDTREIAELDCKLEGTPIYHKFQLKPMSPAETLAGAIFY